MLGYKGPAQPSPTLGDALNAGFLYLEVRCLGCDTHQTVSLDIVRRPKTTPIHELERYMRCKDCSRVRGYPYKRSHLVALRTTKISASDPPSTWWLGSDDLKRCARSGFLYLLAIHRRWRGEPTPTPFQLQSGIVTSLILPRPQEPSSTKNFSPGGCGGGGSCLSTCCALPTPHAAKNKTNEHKRDFIASPLQ
jgi:hypothetical protein